MDETFIRDSNMKINVQNHKYSFLLNNYKVPHSYTGKKVKPE